ncbi:hypothetical protein BDZ89DRAFT_1161117 [Hymenopellis radicata]|nr:hypothetical protein BDZ89DRAFT_1161117 [Hymenopellis radicata]
MHLLIPVDCASSCAFSVLSLALVGLLLVVLWAYRCHRGHSGKLSLWGVLTLENLPDEARSLHGSLARKFTGKSASDNKMSLEMVEAQRRVVYEKQPPVSMAKMIMSRHTFRKPTPKSIPPPPRIPTTTQGPAIATPPPRRSRSLSPPRQQPPAHPRQPPSTMV